jgi:hypothetical protein
MNRSGHKSRSETEKNTRRQQKEEIRGGEDIVHLSTCVKIMDVPRPLWSMFSTDGNKAVLRQQYVSKVHAMIKQQIPAFADSRAMTGRMGTAFKRPGSLDEIAFYMHQDQVLVITVENFGDDEDPEIEINEDASETVIQILEEASRQVEVPPAAAIGARRRMRRKSLRRTRRNK